MPRVTLKNVALVVGVSICMTWRLADGQIVGRYNVGYSPRALLSMQNSHVANSGIGQQHAWFGTGRTSYNPFGAYTPPVKPFSSPQSYNYNRPLVSSMDMARGEVLRGLRYGGY
jgi:hypothetical protein